MSFIPYGRQEIDDEDIAAVVAALKSDWLTTGPKVGEFEKAFAEFTGAKEAVAVSNGTAALHCAMLGAKIGPGDEVIVSTMTFVASANAAVYMGATPVFADVLPDTLTIDPADVARKITPKTKAIVAVDYCGQPCDYDALWALCKTHGLKLISDACHAVCGSYRGKPIGTLADFSTFSLHPVKHFTTGEGGLITTDDPDRAQAMRVFRNHGITSDHRTRAATGGFAYEQIMLGYNYRLTDIQSALGISQLKKLPKWQERRWAIAKRYREAFAEMNAVRPLAEVAHTQHGYHLFVVRIDPEGSRLTRDELFPILRNNHQLGVNVHYQPVHTQPYYQATFGTKLGDCPVAEAAWPQILTIPIWGNMTDAQADRVIEALRVETSGRAAA
jgi:perosamine synthetase